MLCETTNPNPAEKLCYFIYQYYMYMYMFYGESRICSDSTYFTSYLFVISEMWQARFFRRPGCLYMSFLCSSGNDNLMQFEKNVLLYDSVSQGLGTTVPNPKF